jgi:hypothetical protein
MAIAGQFAICGTMDLIFEAGFLRLASGAANREVFISAVRKRGARELPLGRNACFRSCNAHVDIGQIQNKKKPGG